MAVTPVAKTSEFWISMGAMLLGVILLFVSLKANLPPEVTKQLMDLSTILLGGTPSAFTLSRGLRKFGAGEADVDGPGEKAPPMPATDSQAANVVAGLR